jgi:hypothetical protein
MANLSTLYPRLQTEALGAPPALMDLKIRDAARMFMKEVPAWRADHADITAVSGQSEYTLTAPTAQARLRRAGRQPTVLHDAKARHHDRGTDAERQCGR